MNTRVLIADNQNETIRRLARRLLKKGMPEEAEIIYNGRNEIGVVNGLCIKSFKKPGRVKALIYGTVRHPKAERAFFAAGRLRELGIDTPAPRALVICSKGLSISRTYYVCDYYTDYQTLRGVESRADFSELAHALAAFMKKIHAAGVLLKDFSIGNVLFRRNEAGEFEFAVVDINRIRFGVNDRRKLLSAFGKILETREGVQRLAEEYAAGTPFAAEDLVEIYDRTQKSLLRARRFKNFFRKNKR